MIIQHEKPEGVQLGGQTALKLAEKLSKYGIKLSEPALMLWI
jgi:carbamoyl-phosphate synthase large subunit